MPGRKVARGNPSRRRVAARLLVLAQVGHAHWFFGNLYEAIVRVPGLLASAGPDGPGTPTGPGSPARYYVLGAPATFASLLAATALTWEARDSRRGLVTAATCSACGAAATGYLVRAVNLPLFFGTRPLSPDERARLLSRWYRVNLARLAATAGACWAIGRARSRTSCGR
jgi:hypothetical protein